MPHTRPIPLRISRPDIASAGLAPAETRSFQPLSLGEITERQLEVLSWVQEGKSAQDIGGILGISGRTVESHLKRLYGHLGVRTAMQAVLKARALGLIGDAGTVGLRSRTP